MTKKVSTTVSTGTVLIINGKEVTIGTIKNGFIKISTRVNKTSCISECISTRELNKRIKNSINNS